MRVICLLLLLAMFSTAPAAEEPAEIRTRVANAVDKLLAKSQPDLYAWHLRSVRALVESEYFKLDFPASQRPFWDDKAPDLKKEFVEFAGGIADGLEKDGDKPDLYLKEGKRALVLGRLSIRDRNYQYATVQLPPNWNPQRPYPLWAGLHGAGPANPLAYAFFAFKYPDESTHKTEMIRLTPWGRGNQMWEGSAEDDLFEAIDAVKTVAQLDPNRWYLTGHSMGANGVWTIVTRTPDIWAAAGMQSGNMRSLMPEIGVLENLANVPMHFLVGEKDPLPYQVMDTKEASRLHQKLGAPSKLNVVPNMGHYPLSPEAVAEQEEWMTGFVRKRPPHFSFVIDRPEHGGIWGIRVPYSVFLRTTPWPLPKIECDIEGHEVRIKARNAPRLTVDLGDNGLGMRGRTKVYVNGKMVFEGEPQKPLNLKLEDGPKVDWLFLDKRGE